MDVFVTNVSVGGREIDVAGVDQEAELAGCFFLERERENGDGGGP